MSLAQQTLERYWERMFSTFDDNLTAEAFLDAADLDRVREFADCPEDATAERRLATRIASTILYGDASDVVDTLAEERAFERFAYEDADIACLGVLALALGVASRDGDCANYLGALCYMGTILELDYVRAKRLYELAERRRSVRAMINLGYIYEYGRVGEPDHLAAYKQYAKACALTNDFEALYKLGDMYAKGTVVEVDLMAALTLFCRSLEAAEGEVEQAQPAFRIAELIGDAANEVIWDIPFDPMGALRLYQLAERGLRIDIAHGQTYYARRLAQALVGQERMRGLLEDGTYEL